MIDEKTYHYDAAHPMNVSGGDDTAKEIHKFLCPRLVIIFQRHSRYHARYEG